MTSTLNMKKFHLFTTINRSLAPNIFRNKERSTFEERQTPGHFPAQRLKTFSFAMKKKKMILPALWVCKTKISEKCFIRLHAAWFVRTKKIQGILYLSLYQAPSTCNIHRRRNYELVESLPFSPLSISFHHVDNSSKVFHQLLPNSMETRATCTCSPLWSAERRPLNFHRLVPAYGFRFEWQKHEK